MASYFSRVKLVYTIVALGIAATACSSRTSCPKGQDAEKYVKFLDRGRDLVTKGDYVNAIDEFSKAIELKPTLPEAYYERAVAREGSEDYKSALDDLKQAQHLGLSSPDALRAEGRILMALRQYEDAVDVFRVLVDTGPRAELRQSLYALAEAKFGMKEWAGAAMTYSRLIGLDPMDPDAHVGRGLALASQRVNLAALKDFSRAIELSPDQAQTYVYRGWIYLRLKELDAAMADFDEAIKLSPSLLADVTLSRGGVHRLRGEYERAVREYDEGLRLAPDRKRSYVARGYCLFQLKRYAQAIESFDKAIERDKGLVTAYRYRGLAQAALGRHDSAIKDYDKGLELAPQYAEMHLDRAASYEAIGEKEKGKKDREQYQTIMSSKDEASKMDTEDAELEI